MRTFRAPGIVGFKPTLAERLKLGAAFVLAWASCALLLYFWLGVTEHSASMNHFVLLIVAALVLVVFCRRHCAERRDRAL